MVSSWTDVTSNLDEFDRQGYLLLGYTDEWVDTHDTDYVISSARGLRSDLKADRVLLANTVDHETVVNVDRMLPCCKLPGALPERCKCLPNQAVRKVLFIRHHVLLFGKKGSLGAPKSVSAPSLINPSSGIPH